ncbi:hypothetical protein L6V77_25600, partial [Myxococcota bacterium]|nr:hypothetical protein [Myxococcota bacterium]
GIENDATAARAERFANGIVALAHAARNYDATFAALVHGTASGFRRYVDDLANGREERAAEAAARFAAEVELALVPTGAAARHLRNVAKARAGGVLTSVRRAAAHVSPPSPVVPRPTVARGSSWTLDERLSVDLSGFERASAAAGGGVAEPIVVLNRVDGWSRGGYGSKGGTFRDAAGRLRNADGTFAFDGGPKPRTTGGTHGNVAGDQPATLYERYDADGNFLKHGISQDPRRRYTQAELESGYLIETQTGVASRLLCPA